MTITGNAEPTLSAYGTDDSRPATVPTRDAFPPAPRSTGLPPTDPSAHVHAYAFTVIAYVRCETIAVCTLGREHEVPLDVGVGVNQRESD